MNNFKIIDGATTINFDNPSDLVGFEYPDVSTVITSIPGRDGKFYVKSNYESRRLSWRNIFETSGPTVRRNLTQINANSLVTLQFTTCDNLSLQTDIAILKIKMPYNQISRSISLVEAEAPDYRFFSQTLTDVNTAITDSVGGVTLPTALPISFGTVTGTPYLTMTNSGDEKSPAIFTINGPGTNFTVQNVTTGEILQINTTITVNETITIDIANKTVLLNGNTNIFGTKSGTFWETPVGVSQLNFRTQSGSTSDTTLNVKYRSAFKGI